MNDQEIRGLFEKYHALLSGHFLLSSGMHSDTYFQSALVLQYPDVAERLARELAARVTALAGEVDVVVSPALGGVVIGQEMGRALGRRAVFCERVEGKLTLRRNFSIGEGERCLVVEDVITTGLSTREVIEVVGTRGGKVAAVASLVDRSAGKADFGVPRAALLTLDVKSYDPEDCPLCREGSQAVKPGSRG